ncbi:hypothetical protein A3A70_00285 [candidate division WWE3 bacterium RIFCSPLOWO2_01_FULL_42_11]|uniref:Glycosyl transferase family 1 n=1 Tax=candidate division WWE3 bacterium RIFCSPLOWO2_01_FULL_42_11 TaxID=1802627 RepID=A0A1F4VMS2_UNCKA|nr:MAG: hypothetical protein A3A70_00285 [candidate division WWE3 bacterium RIFCSPLOWO2_01_FULL_42_11]
MASFDIICLSTQLWDDPLWTNKQHVMSRMAKKGHKVLYVDPQIRTRKFIKHLVTGKYSPQRLVTGIETEILNQVQDDRRVTNLIVYSPVKFRFDDKRDNEHTIKKINSLSSELKLNKPVLWVYDPEFAPLVKDIPHSLLVYDCVDDSANFPKGRYLQGRDWIRKQEEWLIKNADLVFTTSPALYESRKLLNPKTYYTPNVADYEHNSKAMDESTIIPEDIRKIPHPIIGFQGALANYKIDLKLLASIAITHPKWSLVLIGPKAPVDPETDLSELKKSKNVHFLGTKKYEELPAYYKAFDVAIIPSSLNEYTLYSFPLKFFEYLGAGKLIVSTKLPSLKEYYNQGIASFADSPAEFIKLIENALVADPSRDLEKRLAIAKKNSWDLKVENLEKIVTSELKQSKDLG